MVVKRPCASWTEDNCGPGGKTGGETSRKALKSQLKASVYPDFLVGCAVTSPALGLSLPPALLLMLYASGSSLM